MILDIIKELRKSDSRLHKESVLAKHKDNEKWKQYLKEVYDPFITYGRSGNPNGDLDDLDNLRLLRSIKAGVTATTINKVYGKGFIPKFQPMKAAEIGKHVTIDKLPDTMVVQTKYDGFLTHSIVKDGEVTHYTSNGHPWKHTDNKGLENAVDGVYISELIGHLCDGKLGDRRLAAVQTTFRTNTAKGLKNTVPYQLRIFDYISLDDFYAGKSTLEYYYRLRNLHNQRCLDESLAPYAVLKRENYSSFLSDVVDGGYEGIVLKALDMKWRASTSRKPDFVKYKARKTADLYVIEELEGEGKYQGLIGSLALVDCNGKFVGHVGSGLSDTDRFDWGRFIDKVVEVEFETIHDSKLVQPTFKGIRTDKNNYSDCDCLEDLK